MQQCRIIYCSLAALHVSSGIFAHHQGHLNCIYSRPATTHVYNTRSCKYSLDAPDYERKYRSKHVEQPRNSKLSYTVASFGHFRRLYLDARNHVYQGSCYSFISIQPLGWFSRNQNPVRRPIWLWHTASWASS
jgi:hypothetical protein